MAIGADQPRPAAARPVRLGLRANWPQFTLLVVVNVFAGGVVGLERATTSLVGPVPFLLAWAPAWGWIVAAQEKTDVFRRWASAGKPAWSRA